MNNTFRIIRLLFLYLVCLILSVGSVFSQEVATTNQKQLEMAISTFHAIEQNGVFVDNLSHTKQIVLPVGLKRIVDNIEITLAVNKVVFLPEYSELSIYAKAVIPQADTSGKRTLYFGAKGIKLSNEGSIIGDANLALLQDIEIPFNNGNMSLLLKGDYDSDTGNSNSKTYMSIDCKGFKELGLDAEVRFPTSILKRADSGTQSNDSVVSGSFKTVISGWNDIIADISLPPFHIVGLDGFVFNLYNVSFDFSDVRNAESVRFPVGYEQKYMIPGAAALWRGVYAETLEVTLPDQFKNAAGKPTSFSSQNLLIDDNGISGLFTAENILAFNQGDASGWNFSVQTFSLELEANKLIAAGFAGEIGLPFNGDKNKLNYDAIIRENNEYLMRVEAVDSLDFSMFNAKATILPNSYLTLHVVNHRFKPEALLHGYMGLVDTDKGKSSASIPRVEFRSLLLKTESPYVSVEYLGYSGKASIGNFPISISELSMKSRGDQVELSARADVTLAKEMFKGKTKLTFAASLKENKNKKRWHYDGTQIDMIGVDASIAEIIHLKGEVGWQRNDPVYGDGFSGNLDVGIMKPFKVNVGMKARFGKMDDFHYWFVDGELILPHGIPIVGPLTLKGFSGAVTHRMIGTGNRTSSGGETFSTTEYVPDQGSGLGLKAAVLLNVGSIAHGEACFDINFSNRGGLNFVGFYGFAEFSGKKMKTGGLTDKYNAILQRESGQQAELSKLKQFEPNKAAEIVSPKPEELRYGISGSLGIQYDFRNHSLHAQTELTINALGGFIQGVGSGNKAGWGVMHIDPDEWYLHLGSPEDRLGVKLSLGNILSIRTGSYLMSGSRIPAMPPPPVEVVNILHQDLSRLTLGRNMDALGLAKGFAFGSDFQVKTGDITFLMLYANFMAGLGFDIMLKDYGEAECRGRSGAVGLDGWYAQGQAYAYLQGELGVKVNLWFLKMKFPIIKGGAATLMQAMLPNPAFFKGYLGVDINVLGLIKGNVRFKLAIGEECDLIIPGSSPLDMAMINDLSPQDGDADISVFTMPQATFNAPIGQSFEAEDDKGVANFRIQLKSFTLTNEQGETIEGSLVWNSRKDEVSFQAKEILPPNSNLKALVQVSFERFEDGRWQVVYTSGQESVEIKEGYFTTGGAPEVIPMENVLHTYPIVDQHHYLPDECRDGYVQLQFGQKYLFEKGFDYKLLLTGEDRQPVLTPFTYNAADNRLEFTMPELKKLQNYTLRIAYSAASSDEAQSSPSGDGKQLLDSEDGSLTINSKDAASQLNESLDKSILDYTFATSKYRSFKQKMDAVKTKNGAVAEDAGLSMRLLYKVQADEAFDAAEVAGVDKSGGIALVQPYAELEESFFTDVVYPMTYQGYPLGGMRLTNREDGIIGVPPHKSVFVYSPYLDLLNNGQMPKRFFFPYSYEAAIVWELDFRDIQSQVVNNPSLVDKETYRRFATGRLPFIKKGKYKVIMKYVLPNGKQTSTYKFDYNNFLKLND